MADRSAIVIVEPTTQHAPPRQVAPPEYPYTFLRVHHCGHSSELVQVSNQGPIVHTLVPSAEADTGLEFTLERCQQYANELRERHQRLSGRGREAWLRPMSAYQGEVVRVDRGLLREARRGFEARLRKLNQEENSDEEDEESLSGTDESPSVNSEGGFELLDDCSDTDSFSPTSEDLEEPLLRHSEEMESDVGWTDCGVSCEERQRKDSGFEVDRSIEAGLEDDVRLKEQPDDDAHPQRMISTAAPGKLLDFFTISELIRNNNLSFDEIADLIAHTSAASESEPTIGNIPQVPDDEPLMWKDRLETSDQLAEKNICFRRSLDPRSPLVAHFAGREGMKPRTDILNGDTFSYYGNNNATILQMLQDSENTQESAGQNTLNSCFSSDSSVASLDCTPKADNNTTNKPKGKAWWKPKRKQGIHELSTTTTAPKDSATRLWKRMSTRTSKPITENERILMEKVEKKLQAKYLEAETKAKLEEAEKNNKKKREEEEQKNTNTTTSSKHILAAMRPSNIGVTKIKKKNNNNNNNNNQTRHHKLVKPHGQNDPTSPRPPPSRPTTSSSNRHTIRVKPRGVPRPYRPSPLKNVTRITSLDVNKGLPPLPADGRVHHKVAIKRVINEYVSEMARAY